MGLLTGTAGTVSADKALASLEPFLVESEEILLAFKVGRDVHALTSFRILSLDVQGLTGSRKVLRSVAYAKIAAFTVETAGTFDRDAELSLIVPGLDPITIRLDAATPIADVQRVLAVMTLADRSV
ncbi:MAG: PH domain-containing protein [Pseudomonadota bacterium]